MSADAATVTPFDRRAERIRAQGDRAASIEKARAAAEVTRSRAAAKAQEVALEHQERAAEAKLRARRAHAAVRAERRAERGGRVRAFGQSLGHGLPVVAGAVACIAPTIIATRGQYEFAAGPMQLGTLAVLFPAMLEGAAWLLALLRHRAVAAGEPSRLLTSGVWALALTAAALNVWHGATRDGGSLQVGVAYGLASLVGFALVELLAAQRKRSGRVRRSRIGRVRALRYPMLTFAAWSLMVELGPGADPGAAWRQAWTDRYGVEPGATAQDRRTGRLDVRAAAWAVRAADRAARAAARADQAADRAEEDAADRAETGQTDRAEAGAPTGQPTGQVGQIDPPAARAEDRAVDRAETIVPTGQEAGGETAPDRAEESGTARSDQASDRLTADNQTIIAWLTDRAAVTGQVPGRDELLARYRMGSGRADRLRAEVPTPKALRRVQ